MAMPSGYLAKYSSYDDAGSCVERGVHGLPKHGATKTACWLATLQTPGCSVGGKVGVGGTMYKYIFLKVKKEKKERVRGAVYLKTQFRGESGRAFRGERSREERRSTLRDLGCEGSGSGREW
jgi:hypothetical protein